MFYVTAILSMNNLIYLLIFSLLFPFAVQAQGIEGELRAYTLWKWETLPTFQKHYIKNPLDEVFANKKHYPCITLPPKFSIDLLEKEDEDLIDAIENQRGVEAALKKRIGVEDFKSFGGNSVLLCVVRDESATGRYTVTISTSKFKKNEESERVFQVTVDIPTKYISYNDSTVNQIIQKLSNEEITCSGFKVDCFKVQQDITSNLEILEKYANDPNMITDDEYEKLCKNTNDMIEKIAKDHLNHYPTILIKKIQNFKKYYYDYIQK